jgi:catechol-2,3-dioxygenase
VAVRRLNHAALHVGDAQRSAAFYRDALGMEVVDDLGRAVFLTLPASDAHHDLGLFEIGTGTSAAPSGRGPGLYHLAWEVERFDDLLDRRSRLLELGALVGESDHGAAFSLYAADPDGIEFEVCWQLPESEWGEQAVTRPMDWNSAIERWAGAPEVTG